MPNPRLAPALEVFPTLTRFPALRPRRMFRVPIGCRESVRRDDLQRSVMHLYHDLGVLVFAGCSHREVVRIGDILRQMVTWGGPGGVVSMLDDRTLKYKREREDILGEEGVHDTVGGNNTGIIKLEEILRLAKARFADQLKERVAGMRPAVKDIYVRDTEIVIPGSPSPRGYITLPIESWASLSIMRRSGHLVGEIRFFTVGTGEYVGAATINYVLFQRDRETGQLAPFWAHGRIPERKMREEQVVEERMDKVRERVLGPLWELERNVWGDKAEKLARAREQMEWESLR
ncbi:hypothetical protein PT974_04502 [Cladobotryum mycophilum]|uniref:Uncharacterized protein n=1 Tax=Cladobotryum mycophilum TaxID=491253 RepID=A0ABR0SWE2_9HYPO